MICRVSRAEPNGTSIIPQLIEQAQLKSEASYARFYGVRYHGDNLETHQWCSFLPVWFGDWTAVQYRSSNSTSQNAKSYKEVQMLTQQIMAIMETREACSRAFVATMVTEVMKALRPDIEGIRQCRRATPSFSHLAIQ